MDKITLFIDGHKIQTEKGKTVLQAALDNGIYIPNLCYHPDLTVFGGCRLCMVEINKKIVISCKSPVEDGMQVKTESQEINQIRKITTELLIANHHTDCLSCPKNTNCELQRVAQHLGVSEERIKRLKKSKKKIPLDESNPFFYRDHNRCILCGICIRTCKEIQGAEAIDFAYRGFDSLISTFGNKDILYSRCESCGECVVRCPVGALLPKHEQSPSREVKTVCPYCGVGCGIYLGIRGNKIVGVDGDSDSQVNQGQLCVKGRYGYDFVHSPERIKHPLIRKGEGLVEVSWEEALEYVAKKLSSYQADEVAFLTSAKVTTEEAFVLQKFARAVIKTNHIDHCARL